MSRRKRRNQNSSNFFAGLTLAKLQTIWFVPIVILFAHCLPLHSETDGEKDTFGFINQDREREGVERLTWDEDLYAVAREHSEDMAQRGSVGHAGSDGSQPHQRIQRGGIYASKSAENVARDVNVISTHTSLMESLYHRQNILDPEVTHAAVAIVTRGNYLYVTELFIRKLKDYSLEEARRKLLQQINDFREKEGLPPLALSQTLSKTAQSHINIQRKLPDLSQPLLTSLLAKQLKAPLRINVYTTGDLEEIPNEARENLKFQIQAVGIGYEKIRGQLCENGCYLVTLILGSPQ